MSLYNISKEMFNNGVFTFSNGRYIFIEEIQYSSDTLFWETEFNPDTHIDPRNPLEKLSGHKWRRVRHAGDNYFQRPEYIVAKDGDTPIFRINNGNLEYKYSLEDDTKYRILVDRNVLKGDKGDKGSIGEGWHIDIASYWLSKPDCCSNMVTVNNCNSCSNNDSYINSSPYLMLSLGDGGYVITPVDVGRYRSDDGITWILIVATDVNRITRYTANDALGTGIIDYNTTDYLNTRGKVYYCNDGVWREFINVAVPMFKLSPTEAYYLSSRDGFYMRDYVTDVLNSHFIYDTIAMTPDYKLVVKQNSIEPLHFKDGSFGDGFDEGVINVDGLKYQTIILKPSDIAGFGFGIYTRSDGFNDIEVDARQIVGNGLRVFDDIANSVDGEDRYLIIPKFSDYILNTSGLTYINGLDGFDDLFVKAGLGISVDSNGVNAKVDDSSIYINTSELIAVKDLGIKASHLYHDVVNEDRGLELDNITGIAIKVSAENTALGFNLDGIKVIESGIRGWHLNSDIVDENKSLHFDTTLDKLQVKVKSNGGLMQDIDGLFIDTSNLSWLDTAVVRRIQVNGNNLVGDLALIGSTTDTIVDIAVSNAGNVIKIEAITDMVSLTSLISSLLPSTVAAHTQDFSTITNVPNFIERNHVYGGNIQITTNGLFIKSATTNQWGKLYCVDDEFNLGVDSSVSL